MTPNHLWTKIIVLASFLLLIAHQLVAQSLSQWQWQNPLPQGDPINDIVFLDSLHGWIIPQSSTILRTTNGGTTWNLHQLNKTLRRVSFVNPSLGWAIGSDNFATLTFGIYKTQDGGVTWQQIVLDTSYMSDDIWFTDSAHGWTLGGDVFGSLWFSSNGGVTWVEQAGRQYVRGHGRGHRLAFRDSITGWAGGWPTYVSKTRDGGVTWTRDSSLAGYNRFVFVDSLNGWASSNAESSAPRPIARSTNGGFTWTATPTQVVGEGHPLTALQCIAFTSQGVVQTLDGGNSWITLSPRAFYAGTTSSTTRFWAREYLRFRFYESNNSGFDWVNRTSDTFDPSAEGFTTLWAVDFVDTCYGWTVGQSYAQFPGNNFVARTTNGGRNWGRTIQGLPNEPLSLSFVDRNTGWIVGRSGMIQNTTDGGMSWSQQISGTASTLWGVSFVDSLCGFATGTEPPQGPGVILKTNDGGHLWTDITPSGTPGLGSVQFVDSLYGWTVGSSIFLHTTDGGGSWFSPSTISIRAFFFIDRERGFAYGPYSPNPNITLIMNTTNGGITWREQRRDSSSRGLFSGGIRFFDSVSGYAVGGLGSIWFTSDGGINWLDNSGITSTFLNAVAFPSLSRACIVGDEGAILTMRLDGPVHVKEKTPLIFTSTLRILPNFPNPFNSETTISYKLAAAGNVTLDLYDILGRKVKTLAEGRREAGDHRIVINASDLSSGVYPFIINSGTTSRGGKIVLIR